jgi:hypothetical protein
MIPFQREKLINFQNVESNSKTNKIPQKINFPSSKQRVQGLYLSHKNTIEISGYDLLQVALLSAEDLTAVTSLL